MFVLKSKYRKLEAQLESITKLKNHWQALAEMQIPKLTTSEIELLSIITSYGRRPVKREDIQNEYQRDCSGHLMSLISKGYIKRLKKGYYKIAFAK
jgi:chromosome segregation and condensation protein ScpB